MSLYINSINEDEILSSYNFARNCDIVFSEIVSKEQYKYLKSDNISIIEEDERSIFYIKDIFELKENDVIFTNSYFLEPLFEKLQNIFVSFCNSVDKSRLKLSVFDAILKKFFIAVSVLSRKRALFGSAAITVNPVVEDMDVTSGIAILW